MVFLVTFEIHLKTHKMSEDLKKENEGVEETTPVINDDESVKNTEEIPVVDAQTIAPSGGVHKPN